MGKSLVLSSVDGYAVYSFTLTPFVMHPLGSTTITKQVQITVEPRYVPERSFPQMGQFLFAYQVTITNNGTFPVQVLSREWIIINGNGKRECVEGPGIVGETPRIMPGASFHYTSYCPLDMHWGTMEGTYTMKDHKDRLFSAHIERFYLATPHEYLEQPQCSLV